MYHNAGSYNVTLKVSNGISGDSITKVKFIKVNGYPSATSLDFESIADFSLSFTPWSVVDVNGGNTYGIQGVTFTNNYLPMAYICFTPTLTNPPLTNMVPHSGQRLGCSFSSIPPLNPNNKWLISPPLSLGYNPQIDFWVKSYNPAFGSEKYNVAVSTTNTSPSSFVNINSLVESAPGDWTHRSYLLTNYANQDVFIGIQCVTDNGFIFMIDDIAITSTIGVPENEKDVRFTLWPNPASELIRVKSRGDFNGPLEIELEGMTGAVLKTWKINDGAAEQSLDIHDIPQGLYLLKITNGKSSSQNKISIIH